jgi:hypothetical protein
MTKAKAKEEAAEPETGTAVVSIQDRIKQRLAKVNQTTAAPGSKRISVKGSKFRLPNGTASDGPLNCVIVDYTNSNVWYKDDWVEGTVTPPDCFSIGKIIDELVPHASVEKPVSKTCAECPKNEYGSRGRGKECDNTVLLALLEEGFTEESEVLTLKVAPKGLKDWGQYVRTLQQQGVDPVQVVTSISFVPGMSYPQLRFRALGGNENLEGVGPFMASADALLQP